MRTGAGYAASDNGEIEPFFGKSLEVFRTGIMGKGATDPFCREVGIFRIELVKIPTGNPPAISIETASTLLEPS